MSARASPTGAPLLSKHRADRDRRLQSSSSLLACTQNGVVYTLVAFWCCWVLAMLVLYWHPTLLDPLAHRHAMAAREAAIAREHDGPNHHHGLPGMIVKQHGVHRHAPAEEAANTKTTLGTTEQIPEVTPKRVDVLERKSGHAAAGGIAPAAAAGASQSAASRGVSSPSAEATAAPPARSSSTVGATFYPRGLTRRTPAGVGSCRLAGRSADDNSHQPFEPFSLPPAPEVGSADDYTSDEAPLRQLEVTSVNTRRSKYTWPASAAQKGVLTYMCTSDPEDIQQLRESLVAIAASLTSQYDYPIAIFHEDYTPALMAQLQQAVPDTFIYFVKIQFQLPKHLRPLLSLGTKVVRHRIPNPEHPTGWHEHEHGLKPYVKRADRYPFGYQQMCRFFSGAGFLLPFFDAFDWYWRLDSDTVCHGRAEFDVFDHLSACGMEYSHLAPMFGDGGDVVEGLWNAATNYTEETGLKPKWMDGQKDFRSWGENNLFAQLPAFNTNCEIASLAFLRSTAVQDFHRYLDKKGGYFLHRWGDAPVRFLEVAMHIEQSHTEGIRGIRCMHN